MNFEQKSLIESVASGKSRERAVLGWCRAWTGAALDEIEIWAKTKGILIIAEAREITLKSGLEHTFIRVMIEDLPPMLFDGTGVENFLPYFGLEEEAPMHLRNSKVDTWIMLDRDCYKGL